MANLLSKIALSALLVLAVLPGSDLTAQSDAEKKIPQFLFPVFSKGIVQMKDGRLMSAVLNYNMVDQEMVFEQKGQYLVLDKPNEVDTVFLQNRKFIPFENAFYEVASSGKIALFIQNKGKYTPAPRTSAYGMTSQNLGPSTVQVIRSAGQYRNLDVPDDMVVTRGDIYWARINNEMQKFQTQGQFLKLFPQSEKEIKDFIRKSGIDIKTPEGLAKLGAFCNGLQK